MTWLLNLSEETREMVRTDIKDFAETRAMKVDAHSITLFMLEEISTLRKRVLELEDGKQCRCQQQ